VSKKCAVMFSRKYTLCRNFTAKSLHSIWGQVTGVTNSMLHSKILNNRI